MATILNHPLHHRAFQTQDAFCDWLHECGHIDNDTLWHINAAIQHDCSLSGHAYLLHAKHMDEPSLYRHLAVFYALPFYSLDTDITLHINRVDAEYDRVYCRIDGAELCIGCHPEDTAVTHLSTPSNIRDTIRHYEQNNVLKHATCGMQQNHPTYAIHPRRHILHVLRVLTAIISVTAALYAYPTIMLPVCLSISIGFFVFMLLFKVLILVTGLQCRKKTHAQSTCHPALDDAALPVYTLLLPLFDEADAISGILMSLRQLDYPSHKLDIKFLVEASDSATQMALQQHTLDACMEVITVPHSFPQTKPKACNYGLHYARGAYVTIYDAEDVPHPQQLRHVASIFHHMPHIACVQARLHYYNAQENWLTRVFDVEYRMLFDYMLPALYHLGIPIPLGGTSNHIRCNVLKELGAWDAYNVTEDADLGIRLALHGNTTLPITSYTQEEAPINTHTWVKQRSRWIKGYIQSWGVMQRHHGSGAIDVAGWWGIHFFLGASSLAYILAPLLWGIAIILALTDMNGLPDWLLDASLWLLSAGFIVQWLSVYAIKRHHRTISWFTVVTYPCYFFLHSLAGIKALWQWVVCPSFWEKTTHSVSRFIRPS